jgi:hypothetical protein
MDRSASGDGYLTAVSRPTSSMCLAVDPSGRAVVSTNPTAASPTWSVPTRIDGTAFLSGVSCPSTSLCVAVDDVGSAVIGHGSGAIPPSSISPPRITGEPIEGRVFRETHGTWTSTPARFTYRWERCDRAGARCAAIAGAARRSYKLSGHDVGHRIRVNEFAANTGGGSSAISASTAVVIPGKAQIRGELRRRMVPRGKAARIGALLRRRGCVLAFKALSAGLILINWFYLPRNAHRTSTRHKPKPLLIATGKATFARTRTQTVTIQLTPRGKRVLKHAKRLMLTARGTFTPFAQRPVVATVKFEIRR